MRKVMVQNEKWQPLSHTTVEMFDIATGKVIRRVSTDSSGVASFDDDVGTGNYWYRPMITRRSGKTGDRSLSGAVNINEIDAPSTTVRVRV